MLKATSPYPDGRECVYCHDRHVHPTPRGRHNLTAAGASPDDLLAIEAETVRLARIGRRPHPTPITPRLRGKLAALGATDGELQDLDDEYTKVLIEAQEAGTTRGRIPTLPPDPGAAKRAKAELARTAERVTAWKLANPSKNAEYVRRYRARQKLLASGAET